MSLFSRKESSTLGSMLLPDEKVVTYAKQRKLHGALFYPTIAIATNRRVIIINRMMLRIWSDITFINYEHITSLRVMHGPLFSTIKIRMKGVTEEKKPKVMEKTEGEIAGLTQFGAMIISNAINRVLNNNDDIIFDRANAERRYNSSARARIYNEIGVKSEYFIALEEGDPAQSYNDAELELMRKGVVPGKMAIFSTRDLIKTVARGQLDVGYGQKGGSTFVLPQKSSIALQDSNVQQVVAAPEITDPEEEILAQEGGVAYSIQDGSISLEDMPVTVIPENMLIFKQRAKAAQAKLNKEITNTPKTTGTNKKD